MQPGETVTSRLINAERLMLLGWGRAILLQLAHPLIAAGVSDHSTFRGGPLKAAARLHQTVRAMLSLSFGDAPTSAAAIEGIRAIHRRVHGTLPAPAGPYPAGTPYSAEDPELLLWVHATLLDSIPLVYHRVIRPLDQDERDRYCASAAWVAVALGAREAEVPRTWNALRAYMTETYASGRIAVSPQARELAAAVLAPPLAGPLAPLTWANRLATVGLLPDDIRRQYQLPWSVSQDRTCDQMLRFVRAVRGRTPRLLAWWPEARS